MTGQRRSTIALRSDDRAVAGVVGFILIFAAFITYAIFVVLYVPSWKRFGRAGRWVIPLAFLALVAGYPEYGFNGDGSSTLLHTLPSDMIIASCMSSMLSAIGSQPIVVLVLPIGACRTASLGVSLELVTKG